MTTTEPLTQLFAQLSQSRTRENPQNATDLVAHVKRAISEADEGRSRISPAALAIEGMSSPKVRHLLNNLCAFDACRYLEVGSYKGSTLCAAMSNNTTAGV